MQLEGNRNADHEGYELFRRAIDERDEQAWAEGAARYRPQLIAWASRYSASAPIREYYADIADNAFARAWTALTLRPFASFPTLAALLAYLRTCVFSVVIDCARTDLHFDRLAEVIEADYVATPEQIVLVQLDRDELWRIASSVAETTQQQCVLLSSYVYGLSPRAILERHPGLFADAVEIYTIKRNLLSRLKHCPEIRQFYQEWLGI
jgi:DNA-directed RNA polymerase specialized sigma24 family protein